MRLLLVEDNRQLSDWIAKTLRSDKYTVDCVYSGDDADHVLRTEEYALVILDLALPKLGGLEILRKLRARRSAVPVIILTANDSLDARVAGLNSGADDYLAKPFEMTELEARIRAHLRRANTHQQVVVQCGALAFDSNSRQFTLAGEPLALTAREHAVLETLILRAGSTVSKATLTTTVFGFDDEANPNAIEIYVHRVRKKLAGSDIAIVTLRGLGYVLSEEHPNGD
ncbi:MAG: response regulator [Candidatus Eremiobacteraeota bacterium]|nr:response regulator [Candidatus Eremiobacteraeota bacterium]MBV8643913.1 response regulator [Candidatus Eremiobacteraeota bacterium]